MFNIILDIVYIVFDKVDWIKKVKKKNLRKK